MSDTKALIEFRGSYVLPIERAVEVLRLLSECESYEQKWHSGKDGGASFYTHHVYTPKSGGLSLSLMPNSTYAMYKAAGNPNED